MFEVHGVVQHYDWGDTEVIPQLLGATPDGRPWAELWLGTHPRGPATLADGRALSALTGDLDYLLKVLAATRPLSLQTHPDAEGARRGYDRGVFGDPYPKPELLMAITPVTALCGVRPLDRTMALLNDIGVSDLAASLQASGSGAALEAVYRDEIDIAAAIEACRSHSSDEARWVVALNEMYPGEASVVATLLLNLVEVPPGAALRLDAGNLHAYLRGAGIELMGASDNVVRGGLTSKEVDVDLLLTTVDPTPLDDPVLAPAARFELPAAGVALERWEAGEGRMATMWEIGIRDDGVAIALEPGEAAIATVDTWIVSAC
ncbi:MAG: mannose-6-phosphate isomerase, class I [Actinomycetota bacterium]|nr:mannose-6-phosphate isomerase, class I [Actinomycetota bacterium]MDA3035557.1 mannose-6-phosphate isomerase, class I [Actinomycetota bacterium]